MNTTGKAPVLVVVQLSGGNDFMNTLIPYTAGIYHDSRPVVGIKAEDVLPLEVDDALGWHPQAAPLKEMFDAGDVALVQGIGYPDANRSHFRAMDIWHTCEPLKIGDEGWVGRLVRELDPQSQNVLTGVSFGQGLPRACALAGIPVTSVGDLDNYGLMTSIGDEEQRTKVLEIFKGMYSSAVGTGIVMDYLSQTGLDVIKGADELKKAPEKYTSEVEYPQSSIAKSLRKMLPVSTSPISARASFIHSTAVTTTTPTRSRRTRSC